MGNIPPHRISEHGDSIHGTASIRRSFPLYKTSYTSPLIDHKILEAFAMQTIDEDIEKFRYRPDDTLLK